MCMHHAFVFVCVCVWGRVESREACQDENVEGKTAFEMLCGQTAPRLMRKRILIGMNRVP